MSGEAILLAIGAGAICVAAAVSALLWHFRGEAPPLVSVAPPIGVMAPTGYVKIGMVTYTVPFDTSPEALERPEQPAPAWARLTLPVFVVSSDGDVKLTTFCRAEADRACAYWRAQPFGLMADIAVRTVAEAVENAYEEGQASCDYDTR